MKTFDDPRLASGRAQILKERAEEQTPQRLISDDEYAERMKRLAAAEQDAKANKKGLWSDAEMKRWNPPTDEQMQKDYADHKSWFKSVASLVQADPRLAEVSRDSESWKRAGSASLRKRSTNMCTCLNNSMQTKLWRVFTGLGRRASSPRILSSGYSITVSLRAMCLNRQTHVRL